ncbi:MAG: MarR family winged helix-turn-helix transcriptional regulator [Sphingobacteriaceae bacterium]
MLTEPFSSYSHLLDRTARKVKQYAQRRFNAENFEITVDQWLVLKNLNEHPELNQSELAEIIGKDHPTLTRIIDLLCKKDLVERRVNPADRRSFTVHLTAQGQEKVKKWSGKMAEIRMKAWENLTEQDYKHLKRILDTIYTNLDLSINHNK